MRPYTRSATRGKGKDRALTGGWLVPRISRLLADAPARLAARLRAQ
jgi:hypothetical protein